MYIQKLLWLTMNFGGIYILANIQISVFSKNQNTQKKLDAFALAWKQPQKWELWWDDELPGTWHALVPYRLLCCMSLLVVQVVFKTLWSTPPTLDRTSSSPTERWAWRWHLLGWDCRKRVMGSNGPGESIINLASYAVLLRLSFS